MRHATDVALDRLESLLAELREIGGLREKKRGIFYRKSRAFCHFHEDGDDLYADVRLTEDFERFRVVTPSEQRALVTALLARLHPPAGERNGDS